ncbi:MAG: ABC transporter ATP-binding protein [bacterium]
MIATIKNVSKYYEQPGGTSVTRVLDDISLEIPECSCIAVAGPSGSGKSTLLHILGTLDKPTSGEVIIDGRDVSKMADEELAPLRNTFIGFVFQMHHLLPQLTLMENVLLPLLPLNRKGDHKAAMAHAESLIHRVGLKDHIRHRPSQLSLGERQRAAVVRALINRPRLLLADEPTGSLDAGNASLLGSLLFELNREHKTAMVIVTHSAEIAGMMDSVYHLGSGKLHPGKSI